MSVIFFCLFPARWKERRALSETHRGEWFSGVEVFQPNFSPSVVRKDGLSWILTNLLSCQLLQYLWQKINGELETAWTSITPRHMQPCFVKEMLLFWTSWSSAVDRDQLWVKWVNSSCSPNVKKEAKKGIFCTSHVQKHTFSHLNASWILLLWGFFVLWEP